MRNWLKKGMSYARTVAMTGLVLMGSMVALPVHAALPTGATTAFATLTTDATAVIDAVWPIVTLVVVGFAIMKYFKRGIAKT